MLSLISLSSSCSSLLVTLLYVLCCNLVRLLTMEKDLRSSSFFASRKVSPKSKAGRKENSPRERSSNMNSDSVESVVDRYKYDVEQALAMQKRPATNSRRPLSEEDVKLGLSGLDEAEILLNAGDLKASLRVFELSIELLLKYLRESDGIDSEYDSSMIQARVLTALDDAEAVKSQLKRASAGQPSFEAKTTSTGALQSLTNALTSAIWGSTSTDDRKQPAAIGINANAASRASKTARTGATTRARTSTATNYNRKQASMSNLQNTPRSRQQQPQHSSRQNIRPSASADGNEARNELYNVVLDDLMVQPQNLQETTWDEIAGLEKVKQALKEAAIMPLKRPDLFTGLRKPQNILLWGPPGTGKTMLVKAAAKASGSRLFVCTASTLTSKWMGEAEKLVKALFDISRRCAPSIIFIDEMDSLLSVRKSDGEHEASRRLKTEFMVQMDGIMKDNNSSNNNVLVLACTNCPWDVDSAVLRRFPRRILVPLPDPCARVVLIRNLLHKAGKHNISARQIKTIVDYTEGFSCSDITSLVSEASFEPLRSLDADALESISAKDLRPISYADFQKAFEAASKSVTAEQLEKYNKWQQQQAAS